MACLGRDLLPRERAAIDAALGEATERARRADAGSHPAPGGGRPPRPGPRRVAGPPDHPAGLLEDGRDVALELRRLVHGDLCGMFDGPTTPGLRLDGPLVVLDLSAVYHSPALGVLMACAAAWLQSAVRARHRNRIIVVVDEAWAILSNLGVARWLQTSWKLSRANGVANMAVLHRLSDLRSVGTEGSEQVGLAEGLLADSETRVVYAQSPGEVARTGELLGLTDTEAELVTQLRRGMALWKVGRRSFLVEHRLASGEQWLTDTDQAMADRRDATGRAPDPAPVSAADGWRAAAVGRSDGVRWPPGVAPGRRLGRPTRSRRPAAPSGRRVPRPLGRAGGARRAPTRDRGPMGRPRDLGPLAVGRDRTGAARRGGWSWAGPGGDWWRPSGPSRSSSSGPPSPTRRPASPCRPSSGGGAGGGGQREDRPARPHHRPPARRGARSSASTRRARPAWPRPRGRRWPRRGPGRGPAGPPPG